MAITQVGMLSPRWIGREFIAYLLFFSMVRFSSEILAGNKIHNTRGNQTKDRHTFK